MRRKLTDKIFRKKLTEKEKIQIRRDTLIFKNWERLRRERPRLASITLYFLACEETDKEMEGAKA